MDQVSLENTSLNHKSAVPSYRHGVWDCLTSAYIWLPAVSVEMAGSIKAQMQWAGSCSLLCIGLLRDQNQYTGESRTAGTGLQGPELHSSEVHQFCNFG